jgi:hypothetical protein
VAAALGPAHHVVFAFLTCRGIDMTEDGKRVLEPLARLADEQRAGVADLRRRSEVDPASDPGVDMAADVRARDGVVARLDAVLNELCDRIDVLHAELREVRDLLRGREGPKGGDDG